MSGEPAAAAGSRDTCPLKAPNPAHSQEAVRGGMHRSTLRQLDTQGPRAVGPGLLTHKRMGQAFLSRGRRVGRGAGGSLAEVVVHLLVEVLAQEVAPEAEERVHLLTLPSAALGALLGGVGGRGGQGGWVGGWARHGWPASRARKSREGTGRSCTVAHRPGTPSQLLQTESRQTRQHELQKGRAWSWCRVKQSAGRGLTAMHRA